MKQHLESNSEWEKVVAKGMPRNHPWLAIQGTRSVTRRFERHTKSERSHSVPGTVVDSSSEEVHSHENWWRHYDDDDDEQEHEWNRNWTCSARFSTVVLHTWGTLHARRTRTLGLRNWNYFVYYLCTSRFVSLTRTLRFRSQVRREETFECESVVSSHSRNFLAVAAHAADFIYLVVLP